MGIASSVLVESKTQADGSLSVHERFTDDAGRVHDIVFKAPSGTNLTTLRTARAAVFADRLKQMELRAAVFVLPWDYTLVHATNADLAAFVREVYKNGSMETLALTAKRILEWITEGRFTDTQVRNAFGLTAGEWTTLKAKMQTLSDKYDDVLAATGE